MKIFDISHKSFAHQTDFYINHVMAEDLSYLKEEQKKLLSRGKVENIEFRVKTHEGNVRYLSCNCYLIEEKYIIGFIRDISRAKEHEDYIINYGAKKDTLLEMVSHNLARPLNVSNELVKSFGRNLKADNTMDVHKGVRMIQENTAHCIELVNDFLQEEHFVSERVFVKKSRFNVVDALNVLLERFQKSYPDYFFVFQYQDSEVHITTDEVKFLQIVNNLLSNAVKFSRLKSRIEVVLQEKDTYCVISVKDYGIGIPEHLSRFLFEKNTKARREGLRGEKSIGLGLYIVKRLASLLNIEVSYESKEQEGSTFMVKLPKQEADIHN